MVLCGGGGKPEVAGLWIDYVLLPERLEEHLEGLKNRSLSSPSHAELVNMFLDQAVSSYRLSRKEPDAQAPSSATRDRGGAGSRTVAVLCERAARVAIAGEFVLGDIESLIPRHQSLLLKALIKHDKPRSLLHECNFHRWVIRKTLGPEALGPFATNAFLRAGSHGATSDSAAEFYQDTLLVDGSHIEAGPSVTYLENVLEREKVLEENHEVKKKLLSVSSEENHDKVMEENHEEKMKKKQLQNGLIKEGVLKEDYICQILFDVAEAHFMRGRSKRAHELFSKCGHLASKLTACPVPQERLNGFIVACRAITNSAATDCQNELKTPIPASQESVFACEKSRSSIKRKSQAVFFDYCNGVHETADGNRSKKIAVIKSNGVADLKQVPSANGGCELKVLKSETVTSAEEGGKDLVDVVADDVSARNLSWGYCLSLETDESLPALVRVKVAICNVLRSVLEGGSFDSFLRISGQIEDNKEAVVFLLQLMAKTIDGREGKGTDDTDLVSRVRQFCNYVCCTVEQSWCWKLASKHGLISAETTSKLGGGIDQPFPQGVSRWGASSGMITMDILQADSMAAVEQAATSASGQAPESIAKLVQQRAFAALEKEKDPKFARQLYTLAKRICSESIDNELFLWFLDRKSGALPEKVEGYDCPSYGAAEYVFVKLMEAEQWSSVQELCSWAQQRHFMEDKAVAFIFKEADVLGALIPMCSGEIGSSTKDDEIIRKLEDLMTLLLGLGEKDEEASRSSSDSLLPGPKAFPIISKLSRVESLQSLENLLAGWINGLQAAAPLVELARYGALAQVTANIRPRALKASADCGKKLFTALLQRLLQLPRAAEEDSKGSSRWLLGLADLAFVDQAYLEALQLYLQAGAVRSSFYCDRVTSMARELFTPWVITRMIAACKEIGAQLQAAILCQCLPDPDYESAFQILQANPLIVDQDAALYFECVWEMPLLELLVHLHAKAGDRGRVNMLISLLQQPALNVHNPASIRKAHIAAMEQRFLQRFYAELM